MKTVLFQYILLNKGWIIWLWAHVTNGWDCDFCKTYLLLTASRKLDVFMQSDLILFKVWNSEHFLYYRYLLSCRVRRLWQVKYSNAHTSEKVHRWVGDTWVHLYLNLIVDFFSRFKTRNRLFRKITISMTYGFRPSPLNSSALELFFT